MKNYTNEDSFENPRDNYNTTDQFNEYSFEDFNPNKKKKKSKQVKKMKNINY